MQDVMQMMAQMEPGMVQQLMQGLGNNAEGGAEQQQLMMHMMQQMLGGQPPGQAEGEGEPGQCPTQ